MASERTVELPRPELSAARRALIEARLRGQVRSSGIVPRADRDGAPLSFAQERLWFIDRLEPGSAVYNIPVARRLGGALDVVALERGLGEIVRRHEALRTVFREVDGSPVQVIAPFGGFTLRIDDLSGLADADREVEVRRRATQEAVLPFDLTAGPLVRARVLRLGEESHVLLLSMHHIVSDGWSMGVFFRELSALYEAYREGRESPLPELGVQYADYAAWQRERLRGEVLDRQLSYWKERLAGAPELLELPTERPRPAVQTFRGAQERIELPGELLERLRTLGRSEGATLYMVALSAFQALLSKYSGSEDVVVGSPVAGRTRKEVAGLIGFFVNTLVLRTDLSGDPSFREVLGRVREVTLGAYEHQELPFEKLVAELQPERSLSHSPLFQVSFALEDVEEPGNGVEEFGTDGADADLSFAKFDLTLAVVARGRDLRGKLSYGTDLFERGTIVRMLGHLGRVLEQVAADADVRLSQLELLGDAERALVLEEWNRTAAGYPADRCIHELFEARAARAPDAVAIEFEGETLSYGALNERANRLAHHLAGLGVGPETRVGICLERSLEMVVSLLAVLKAGGAYVPLDPGYPAERLAYVLDDSAVPLVLVQAALRGAVPAREGVGVLAVDALAERLAAEPAENPAGGAGPDSLAYVIYTSGSTGRPKGVMNAHRGVVNRLAWMQAHFRLGADDVVLQKTPFGFDVSVWELFWPLQQGARLVMARPDGHRDPAYLGDVVEREGVTTLHFVPSMLQPFVEAVEAGRCASLRHVVCSGEALPPALVRRFYDRFAGPVVLTNLYGPTEAAVDVSCWTCPRDGAAGVVPIGRPVWNTALYVLDALRPVPVGTPGELYIGGVQVARGYQGRSAMTAERFIPDPFSVEGGARLYRTGDRARWRADGAIEYLGRLDDQVKVRGFRIELGEIEAALRPAPGVSDCAVVAREDETGDRRLVAYIVGEADAEALRARLRRSLPEYMVPAAFVVLERLPLTPNGKLDRKALPAPEYAADADRYVAPRTPTEEVLAGIWAETLRLETVGVEESFFELGGHSLLATRVVSRVRDAFAIELPLRALFEGPTVAELAGRVEALRRAGLPTLPPVVPTERGGALPLSFAQERLWFIDRLEPGSAVYNIPVAWRLEGALDRAALERALGEIVRRHEALRTVFTEVDGSPVQVIAPFAGFALPVEDLSGLGEADREAALGRRAGEEARRAFDLSAGPLFRAALLRLGEEDHVLLLSMHHIVSDGWSLGVLFREVAVLYEAYREGGESPLPELGVQYADYAVWQREQLAGEALERQLGYWRDKLRGAPELLELPTDHPRPAVQTYRGATVPVELSPELLERLQALGRSEGATLYMTLLGAFQVLLSRYGGSEDVVVGSPIAGRTRREVEELIGFFVNTLVLRTDLSGDPSFRETLRRVREATLGAYAHQEVPFERLVAELQPERSLSHSPLFQVMFALQNAENGGAALPGLSVSGVGAELASAKFDLSLVLTATARGLRGGLTYSTDLFERSTVDRMLGHLARVLEQVAADADARLSRLELLGGAERARLLALGEGAAPELPRATVDALFAQAAAAAPEAVALAWDGGRMTYAELDDRANRLAHHLRRAGVAAGTRVGVCLERGPEMVVATLAALKAGGAYVPLDPAYPAERLAFMLADTAVPVLVTESPLADRLPPHAARILRVDTDAAAIAAEPADAPAAGTDPEAAAYVMYTSGSTGRPKGVEVPHRAIVRLVRGQDYVSIDPSDVFLQLAPASFDAATLELWGPLLNGARLAIHPAGQPTVESIGRALAEHGVTVLWLTAGLFHLVVEERIEILRGVRQLLAGGDVLSVSHVRRVPAELPETALLNGYGPTENTVFTCCHRVGAVPRAGASIPVGRPIANTYVRVLDAAMQPVPAGVPGELYAGGAGLALGYLNQPELTAEKFVADPFAAGARLYRTGDRVRWRADGTVEFLGRVDTQVKIRGFRVEPGEVEAALRAWPGVREAAVVVREDTAGDRRLVAYVAGEVAADEVREHLRGRLPEHMLPGAIVRLDGLPLTANGKLDREALPAPDFAPAEERYVAPRTPTEEVLAGIWAETLRLETVGVEDGFFELGGHSLLATRVVSRVRELFGVELPLRALFEGPTVAELAGRVEEMRRAGLPTLPPVVPTERTGPLPLSFAQERLWFIDRLEPGSAVYNIPVAWRLEGALDRAALERALGEIVRRHEALRTVFTEVDGSPVQVIAPFSGFALAVEDLSGPGEADREAALGRRAGEEARRAFDLSAGPLFRAALLRLGEEDHVLLLSMHHIVSDGWSLGVLFGELSALYAAYREGGESPLPELAVQYADYAVWQREQLEGETLERQLGYWRGKLRGAPELLELPTDHPRPAAQSFRGAIERVQLPPEVLERLRALGRREGATLYMVVLGAFQALLGRYGAGEDVVVGSPIAGRGCGEVEELIGFFVNTLVLRTDLSGDPSFRELVGRVREVTLGAYEHQEVPFERLVAELSPERSLSHSPLFQAAFSLDTAEGTGGGLAGLSVSGVGMQVDSAKFDLALAVAASSHGMRGGLIYSTDLWEAATMQRLLGHFTRLVEQAGDCPERRLSELSLLGDDERARLLVDWNAAPREAPGRCVHELFAEQAARTPDAVAVTSGSAVLTYAELDRRSDALARALRGRGVRPEAPVGLCVERSAEMVAAVLGILKAGGAFVPLDPQGPAERLAFMLEDSGARLLLTDGAVGDRLAGFVGETVWLDAVDEGALPHSRTFALSHSPSPDHLAYVIYTSGSTGTPKGVAVTHGSLANTLLAAREEFGFAPGDVMPSLASFAFDIWLFEALLPLLAGGSVRVVPRERVMDVAALVREIESATLLHAVPALMRQVVDEVAAARGALPGLRRAFVGGDAVPPELPGAMRAVFPGAEVRVLYGPTEGTIICAAHHARGGEAAGRHLLGPPLGNAPLYVLDGAGEPAPVGVPGELCIGGAATARGYLGRTELTADRFVPDPFAREAGARMYRTGDRARWGADGVLEFLGRVDQQVKVRGFRIELGEIEGALRRSRGIADCVVVAREDAPGEKRLVAYVVGDVEAGVLREHLRQGLPEYMVPAAFVVLERLPLTANGKLDRKALPAPDFASAEDRYVAPRTPTEEVLAGIWAETLRLETVGVTESFFELGGHSLLATRVVLRVQQVFGVEVPLRALFEGPTVAELAGRVEEMRRAGLPALPPVVPTGRAGALPLSFAQERLWFLDRLQPESAFYNVPVVWRAGGALDEAALERALGEVVRRHEALRTTFPERDGAPVQVVAPFGGFALPVHDLSALPEAEREAQVRLRVEREGARPFDLSAGPLFRTVLLRLDAEDHVLLLCMHHILCDQWSMEVLRRELSALYGAYREGGESPLPEPAVQYADYAVWQREQLSGEVLDRHLAYWKERLAGAPELLELPTDHPRPAVQSYRGAHEGMKLSGELLARLEALGRSEGATLFMTLMGAFQVLLGRYAGSEDVVVGSPIAGRTRREVEELIGLFLNTLVLRTDLSGDPGFRATLRRVREATLGAFEHQEIPFERLVTELQPGRSLSYSPLFQVMFVLQEAERSAGAAGSLELRSLGAGSSGTSKFDLTLFMVRHAGGLTASLEYDTDLFERGTIRRMLGHLERVLEQVAADADVRLSELELLGDAERRQVVAEWNATEAAYPRERCAHELFEAQAERTPGAVALRHAGGSLTYGELEERANRLARRLRGLGVGPDARVGLCLERGPELMVGLLGILKAGGAYVPLDPAYPGERLAYMLEDSAARVLLTQASLVERCPAGGAATVRLDADAGEIEREGGERLRVPVGPDNLAYVIYTSGSTGRPKGVAMPHRPLVNLLAWQEGSGRAPRGAVTLQFASISFDVSFQEIFSTWCAGGTLVLTTEETRADLPRLARLLEAERIERLFLPFIALQHLAEASGELGIAPASLAEVITAGEQLRVTGPIRRWLARMPGCALVNQYGPSETHVVSARVLEGEPAGWPLLPSIGTPVANTRLYVLSRHLDPAPVGVPGELLLGGDALARGYLGRPDLTAERFVPDPLGVPGGRLYRTGDRARWLPGGEVEYLGRTDEQVKVRGFRIEPGEVEAVLSDHPEVREALVVVREDAPGDRRLVAYVVAGGSATVAPAELRAHLKGRLPEYMVPSAVVVLERLPLTPSGKVARRALPAPDFAPAEARYVAPRTPTEEVLAGIWAETLRLETVGVEESFFELGGHSLLATRVVSRIRELFGVELPLRALFEGPTVAELAERVEEMRRAGLPTLPPVVPTERTGPLPLSFAQERLWFIDRLEPGSAVYNIPVAWRLGGTLDRAALERALGEIVRRHEALRTIFTEVDGSPVQVIAPFSGFALAVEDLSGPGEADREAALRRRAGEEARRAFDLSAGPLFRAALLRLGAEDHVLLLSMHHIVSDGWSLGVLFGELSALYAAYREGGESPLPELGVQYADYAVWQREQLAGETLERQLGYWRGKLRGAPELLELPTDHPRPAAQSFRGAIERVQLPPEVLERLRALGRREGATLYMVVLGAFQALLCRYGAGEDVVVGSPIAGRGRGETEELIGFFVNTLVLRTDLSGDPSFRDLARRVREVTLGAYEHQDVPFERLVAELSPERSLSHSPLFQAAFSLDTAESTGGGLAGLSVQGVGTGLEVAKFDLSLGLAVGSDGLRGVLAYSTDLWDAATMQRLVSHFTRLVEQAGDCPERRLSELSLLGDDERARLLVDWNAAPREAPGRCVHELFAEQAARTPGAVAVACGSAVLTYAELDRRSDALARILRDRGVRPEVPVALCVERSAEMVAAALGILRAGGVFVPLDPQYPAERLAFMLEDSGARLLLTDGAAGDRLAGFAGETVWLDAVDEGALSHSRTPALPHSPSPDHLAYVIYTSGSTGRPKGVAVTHASLASTLLAARDAFGFGPGDVMPSLASFAFDIWLFEALLPLLAGGSVRVVPRERVMDVAALVREIEGATTLHAVPALMRQVVDEVAASRGALPGLRRAFVGGDAVPPELPGAMRAVFPGAEVRVLYGPTEGTIICAAHHARGGEAAGRHLLGRPLGNAPLYVLDGAGEPAPMGVPGELCIGGAATARGYLGRPELTAERFVPDPFAREAGARTYRTGDRARWGADGVLEFLGRVDQQVKIRGFRIEPGEVEAQLAAHPGVGEAVVLVREDAPGEKRLVGYVVPSGEGVSPEGLREHLRARLPEHMVPSAVVVLESMPLSPNGKVDRRALPAPDGAGSAEHVAPRTPTEEVLAGIWAEVLGVERVGADDDFFELGGHSLLATRLASRVREAFRAELPLRAVFEAPTVAELARRVDAARGDAAAADVAPPLLPAARDGSPLPLSFAQQRLWILDRMEPGSTAYNMPLALRLRGPLDPRVLGRALAEVVRRHESLRTTFGDVGGAPFQVVHPAAGSPIGPVDLARLPASGRDAEAARLVREHARRPFDLAAGPLFRPTLLRLADAEHVLLLGMHHIVSDGWSMGVMFRELAALYEAFARGEPSPLPELPVQYADFAAWQRAWLSGGVLERELAWWRERLAGAPAALELPTDRPRPPVPGARTASAVRVLPRPAAEGVRALARREGATTFMVLLAVLDLLLARWSGEEDVVVGTPIANRNRRETEGLIGFFVNTLALRADVSGEPDFRGLLARVREATLGAYQHQDVPFERLVEALGVERATSHTPLFQVMFSVQDGEGAPRPFGGMEVAHLDTGAPAAKFDLSVTVAEGEAGLAVHFGYREELWAASTIGRVVDAYALLLEGAVADPSRLVLDLPLLGEAERERVLREWSGWDAASPAAFVPVHERVAARAAETPDAIAVVCGAARLSYGGLDARSAELAGRLRARGVGPEARVAVLAGRSPEGIVAMLAVLRAGGAYLPLDPATPRERVARILEDAGVRLVLAGAEWADALAGYAGEVVRVDGGAEPRSPGGRESGAAAGAPLPCAGTTPESAAYVVYTSGSTGTPKGVVATHGGLASLVDWHLGAFGVTAADRATQLAGLGFDAAVWEIWPYLAAGATLLLVDEEEARTSPAALGQLLLDHAATLAFVPTPLAAGLLALEWPARTALRALLTGGDALRVRPRVGLPFELVNAYGPTENTVVATAGVVAPGSGEARSPDIGRPVAGVWAYVLGPGLDPVPAGFPGELWLGGASLARGYLGRPELTAAAFAPDPFSGRAGARLYRTGDRVRWLPDGTLEFLGRTDRQVKVRGFRIEPGEIEAVLGRHPAVRGAAVTVREDRPGDRRVVAYLVADGDVPVAELRELARASLPEYMVPAAIVGLDALPLTPTGKLDRRALPAPEAVAADDVEPRTELEGAIATVWAEVLGVPRVGTAGSFFDLGGNSLLVVQLVARLEAALGRKVPVLDVFRYPSVAALARHLSGEKAPERAPPADPDRSGKLAAGKGRLGQLRKRRDADGE